MKKYIVALLIISLSILPVRAEEYKDLPPDIFSNTETYGKKHLRLIDIPSDKEANDKVMNNNLYCHNKYCLVHVLENETECKFIRLPTGSYNIPCLEWVKAYDDKGKLHNYSSYSIDPESKKVSLKYSVQWHENGQISAISYFDMPHRHFFNRWQAFDKTGKLIRDCEETSEYINCSEYDEQKREWIKHRSSRIDA